MSKIYNINSVELSGDSADYVSTTFNKYLKQKQTALATENIVKDMIEDAGGSGECPFDFNKQHEENVLYDIASTQDVSTRAMTFSGVQTRDSTKVVVNRTYGMSFVADEASQTFSFIEDSLSEVDKPKIFLPGTISKDDELYTLSQTNEKMTTVPDVVSVIELSDKISEIEIEATKATPTKIISDRIDLSKDTIKLPNSSLYSNGGSLKHKLGKNTVVRASFDKIFMTKNFFMDKNLETASPGDFGDFSESVSKLYVDEDGLYTPLKGIALKNKLTSLLKTENVSTSEISVIYYGGENPVITNSDVEEVLDAKSVYMAIDLKNPPSGSLTVQDSFSDLSEKLLEATIGASISTSNMFENFTKLTSVSLTTGVQTLANYAFSGCNGLKTITIPSSVTSIGTGAFDDCTSLENVKCFITQNTGSSNAFSNVHVNILQVDPSITTAFEESLKTMFDATIVVKGVYYSGENPVIDNSVTYSGNIILLPDPVNKPTGTLSRSGTGGNLASKLVAAEISGINTISDVTTYSDGLLYNSTNLTSLTIGTSVTKIGNNAFRKCSSLESISIPDSVSTIGAYAFNGCNSVSSIVLSTSLTEIGGYVFADIYNVSSVKIPENIALIGSCAFNNCSSLKSLKIPSSTRTIEGSAFANCTSLQILDIPDGVTKLGSGVFDGCSSLVAVKCMMTQNSGTSVAYSGVTAKILSTSSSAEIEFKDTLEIMFGVDNSVIDCDFVYYSGENPVVNFSKSSPTNVAVLPNPENWPSGTLSKTGNTLSSKIIFAILDGVETLGSTGVFANCVNMNSVVMSSIKSIDDNSFKNCTSLTSVDLPDVLTNIGNSAFEGCISLNNLQLTSSIQSFGDSAFKNCVSITSIDIPSEITEISSSLFEGCVGLNSLQLSNSIQRIDSNAFKNCTGLTKIVVPDNVTRLEADAFTNCDSVERIDLMTSNSITFVGSCSGLSSSCVVRVQSQNESGATSYFSSCTVKIIVVLYYTSATIPNNATYSNEVVVLPSPTTPPTSGTMTIASGSGNLREKIMKVDISGVDSIGEQAFYTCSNLITAEINCDITSIGNHAFASCENLDEIKIPSTVSSIGTSAFENCFKLSSANLPDITDLDRTFYNCYKLKEITIPSTLTNLTDHVFANCSSLECGLTIPSTVSSLGDASFYNCSKLISIEIPSTVTSLGANLFDECISLKSVVCPITQNDGASDVYTNVHVKVLNYNTMATQIKDTLIQMFDASYYATTAVEIVFYSGANPVIDNSKIYGKTVRMYPDPDDEPSGVMTRSGSGGDILKYLLSLELDKVEAVQDAESSSKGIFTTCSKLRSLTVGDSVKTIGKYSFYNCSELSSIQLGSSVETINDYVFYRCSRLTSLSIPDQTTYVGTSSFYNCSTLTALTLGSSIETIKDNAFYGCSAIKILNIPDSTTYIGKEAFYSCAVMSKLTIGSSVKFIGSTAFNKCTKLQSLNIPNATTYIDTNAFYSCITLTGLTLGSSLENIGNYAFYMCKKLSSLNIPNVTTYVGNYAFNNCNYLTSLTIGSSVKTIGNYAFNNCSKLTSAVNIPDATTSIGNYAFKTGMYITALTLGSSLKTIGNYAFATCQKITGSLIIPDSVTSIGNYAFNANFRIKKVKIGSSVSTIGDQAFLQSYGIQAITIPSSVTSIGASAFDKCMGLKYVKCSMTQNTGSVVPYTATTANVLCTTDNVPDSFKSTLQTMFNTDRCYSESEVLSYSGENPTISNSTTYTKDIAIVPDYDNTSSGILTIAQGSGNLPTKLVNLELDYLSNVPANTFKDYVGLTRVGIRSSIGALGNNVFEGCTKLANIEFDDDCAFGIPDSAFYNCSSLTSISIIYAGIPSISDNAFYNCTSLTSLTLPNTLTSISSSAFNNCSSLTEVSCLMTTTLTSYPTTAFTGVTVGNLYLKSTMPAAVKTALTTAFNAQNVVEN